METTSPMATRAPTSGHGRGALEVACALISWKRARAASRPHRPGGDNVSGGQRQRLAMARACAAPAGLPVRRLSALVTPRMPACAPRAAAWGRLHVILVAQRISTVLAADRIVVLDEGRVAGVGTTAKLMETCPAYQEIALWQLTEEELADPIPVGATSVAPRQARLIRLGRANQGSPLRREDGRRGCRRGCAMSGHPLSSPRAAVTGAAPAATGTAPAATARRPA